MVTSPQLVGIDGDGHPGSAFQRELVRALAMHLTASRYPATSPSLRAAVGEWAEADLTGTTTAEMESLREIVRDGNLIPLEGPWQAVAVQNRGAPQDRTLVASIFGYAQETFGGGAAGRLLEASDGDLTDALRRAYGVSLDDFQAGWQAWLQAGASGADLPA